MFLHVLLFSSLSILIGLAFMLFGYRFFRILLPIWAFFAGLFFGISGFDALMGGGFLATSMGLIAGFFVGLFFAIIAYFAYAFAVILFGASLGFAIGQGALLLLGFHEGFITWLTGIALAIVFIMLFAKFRMPRLIIVIATAFGGAMAVITGIFVLFGQLPPDAILLGLSRLMIGNSFIWMLLWIAAGAFGTAVQYATEKQVELMQAYEWEKMFGKQEGMPSTK